VQLQAGVVEGLVLSVLGEDGGKFVSQLAVALALCQCSARPAVAMASSNRLASA